MPSIWILVVFVALVKSSSFVDAAGNVGCLFSEELCNFDTQRCFDDSAFGRCVPLQLGSFEEPYRHHLNEEELETVEYELGRLLENGYRWSHRHTQCVLQSLLHSFQTGADFDRQYCDNFQEENLERALASGDVNDEDDPTNWAQVKYSPNDYSPSSDFARIIYYSGKDRQPQEGVYATENVEDPDEVYPLVRRSLPESTGPERLYPFRDDIVNDPTMSEREDPPSMLLSDAFNSASSERQIEDYSPNRNPENQRDDEEEDVDEYARENFKVDESPPWTVYQPIKNRQENDANEGFTEGGAVPIPFTAAEIQDMQDSWLESLGFMRKERLDVKKPGPPYDPAFNKHNGNYFTTALDKNDTQVKLDAEEVKLDNEDVEIEDERQEDDVDNYIPHKYFKRPIMTKPQSEKKMVTEMVNYGQYDVIDTTYAYIKFKNDIKTWKEGRAIVDKVAELLKVPKELFIKERVDRNEVTFKVREPNKFGLNGTEVAKRVEGIKEEIGRTIGVVVTATGIGDKSKLPSVERLDFRPNHEVYVVTVIVCGVLAALALSGGVLYLTRRHGYKLANMTSMDPESSKLYQVVDLCRARMSAKTTAPPEKCSADNTTVPVQRIASLSKESDKESPSSRSSTSSWSEEPALTNMDIGTGKIVLAHIEEHLKDAERLETEWGALCIYEADPCSSAIAQRPENEKKNRNQQALPYDHARVVLNELSNISESDYVNASTIADHDPRNAAYIVTQGPLPHSVPDLWQMVWEQGCVVIVMLTRLGEPDAPLCHRYWPEDGSEIYHIYEVHLVGEYMWCDDYVVRSFYLKNMKTGETRTVTQFHYLSWPENGIPAATKSLLEFRRKVNKSFRGRSCPIVVHCSDGVGRSGTYVLLDMVLNRIAKGAKEIDVAATLEHIRDQRAGAVATKKQFQYVLQAVADEVTAILKVLQQQ